MDKLMLELKFSPVQLICLTGNLSKRTLTGTDPHLTPHPSEHCVLTTRLTHTTHTSLTTPTKQLGVIKLVRCYTVGDMNDH